MCLFLDTSSFDKSLIFMMKLKPQFLQILFLIIFWNKIFYRNSAILIQNADGITLSHRFGVFSAHALFAFKIVFGQHIVGLCFICFFFILVTCSSYPTPLTQLTLKGFNVLINFLSAVQSSISIHSAKAR